MERNIRKNITEGRLFEAEDTVTVRNNSLTAGRIFKSTEVLGRKFSSEAPLFSTKAVLSDSVGQGVTKPK